MTNGGRWPANVIHDGSPEVVRLFPHTKSGANKEGSLQGRGVNGVYGDYVGFAGKEYQANEGSAARFFFDINNLDEKDVPLGDYTLHTGNCLDVMAEMDADSVDTIVTDPPYGLEFMGKDWDHGVPGVRFWKEALRVAKPGAFLLAFGGTRTFHRLAVAIEDAGWEIRDTIMYIYGSGFPKSHNIYKALKKKGACTCGRKSEQTTEYDLRDVRSGDVPQAVQVESGQGEVLQPRLSKQGASSEGSQASNDVRRGQSILEGRGDVLQEEGQLQGGAVRSSAEVGASNGAQGRLHNGASPHHGSNGRAASDAAGSGTPPQPRPIGQSTEEPGTVALQREPQEGGVGQDCPRCGKPIVDQWDGYGSALKPAFEPVIVAMKPISTTFAENALAYGVAGLWIDGARVPTDDSTLRHNNGGTGNPEQWRTGNGSSFVSGSASGRWPANLIHDGSDEVLAGMDVAARFFYCAKASRSERNAGDVNNGHPTVKPLALMRYLVRLTRTPTGGVVLDPFMGSGTTGAAAVLEGREFVGIDMEPEYVEIARRRIEHWRDQRDPQLELFDA